MGFKKVYMVIDNVPGDSKDVRHLGQIEAKDFGFGDEIEGRVVRNQQVPIPDASKRISFKTDDGRANIRLTDIYFRGKHISEIFIAIDEFNKKGQFINFVAGYRLTDCLILNTKANFNSAFDTFVAEYDKFELRTNWVELNGYGK